ncbi:MAG: HAMP domain-containing histidine kinase [Acidimicrobiaceae bacterium]|nr:HAMP domain-containing histidine kinase [Acidimicrobiaceae bacterium]
MQGLILAVVLGGVAVTLVLTFSTSYQDVAARGLVTELKSFASAATSRPHNQSLETFSVEYLQTHALASGGAVLVALPHAGRVQTAGSQSLEGSSIVQAYLKNPPRASRVVSTTIGATPVEMAEAPLYVGPKLAGTVIATADLSAFAAERTRVLALSLLEASIALLAATAGGYLLLRQLLRTVGRITSTADELGRSSLDQRLGDQGRDDEVGDLARTLDEMLDRIQVMMQAQRRLLADVSHQLRTPLTVTRGHLEILARTGSDDPVAVRETIDLVVDEITHMSALVQRLLMLGHAMDPEFLDIQPVDLRALLGDCFAAAQVLDARQWALGPVPDVVLLVDEAKLRGAILNLVANSVNATSEGDSIRLGASLDQTGAEISICVDDSGPGIPPSQRSRALERFSSLDGSTSGSGLGLAIVKAVCDAHDGRVEITSSQLGGAQVSIVLPSARLEKEGGDPS